MTMSNDDFNALLEEAGAEFSADGTVDAFADLQDEIRAAANGAETVLCPLTGFSVLVAAGSDAGTFLQGQLTCDVRALEDSLGGPCGLCTPKGRLLALPWLVRRRDEFLMVLPKELLEPLRMRLARYVLRADVSLTEAPLVLLGLSGPEARLLAEDAGLAVPSNERGVAHGEDWTVICQPGPHPRLVIAAPAATAARLWERLCASARPVGAGAWRLLDVLGGLPQVLGETSEAFLPQALNLDHAGGISFDKGCYTGQEIVARVHYRGTVKRRAQLFAGPGPAPEAGATVQVAGSTRTAGQVILSAIEPEGGFVCLAAVPDGEDALQLEDGRALAHRDLPAFLKAPPEGAA